MSADPKAIDGPLIMIITAEAKSIEAANQIVQLISAIKKKGQESIPGLLTLRLNQFEQHILVYEEYADHAALAATGQLEETKKFRAAVSGADGLLASPLGMTFKFYKERVDN